MIRQLVQEILAQQQTTEILSSIPLNQDITPTTTPTSTPESTTPATTTEATTTESTTTPAATTPAVCTPNWQCSGWQQPASETLKTVSCGESFTQTRTCADSNNCANDGKPSESQEVSGNQCSAQNATGTCQSGSCSFTCVDGFSNCDNDLTNSCEVQLETPTSTCP